MALTSSRYRFAQFPFPFAKYPSFDENRLGIITSQLPVEHWHAWIGDATIADAILDRIMQRNHRRTPYNLTA